MAGDKGDKGAKAEAFALIPRGPLAELARLYDAGARKYAPNNWRKGYAWSLSANALERHYALWLAGETIDPETGTHHLAAVAFHAFALIEFAVTHPEHDDLHEFEPSVRTDVPVADQWEAAIDRFLRAAIADPDGEERVIEKQTPPVEVKIDADTGPLTEAAESATRLRENSAAWAERVSAAGSTRCPRCGRL